MADILKLSDYSIDTSDFILVDSLNNRYDCRKPMEISILHLDTVVKVYTLWLYLYLRFKISPDISWDDIIFVRIDDTLRKFPYKCVFLKPYIVNTCYRIVPSFTQYAISDTGICINRYTQNVLTPRLNAYGYQVLGIRDPITNEYRDVGVHWLVANAWVNLNQNNEAVTVNHKDTNKLNNNASNLEWVTYKNNVVHAKEHGIIGKEVCVKLSNIRSNEVVYFDNMTAAASYLDVDVSAIKSAKFNNTSIINDLWYVEFVPNVHTTYTAPSHYTNRKIPIEVCKDGEFIGEVKSLRELNSLTGICRASLSRLLNSEGRYSLHGYAIRRKSCKPWPSITNISQYKAVAVTDQSGNVSYYPSIKDASIALNIDKSTVKRMLIHPKSNDSVKIKLIST